MSLLLDTHVVLWWLEDSPALTDDLKDRLDRELDVYVSAATVWEVAIKQALGKLGPPDLPNGYATVDSGSSASPPNTEWRPGGCRRTTATPSIGS